MPDCPTPEPKTVIAGDTVRWLRSLPEYPTEDGWALTYTLINASGKLILHALGTGTLYEVHSTPEDTESWVPGQYAWRARVSKIGGDAITVAEGSMTVRPSFGTAETLEARSAARIALDAIEDYLRNPNSTKAKSYEIEGRKLQHYELADLWAHRDRLRLEVKREEQAACAAQGLGGPRGRVYVRFGP